MDATYKLNNGELITIFLTPNLLDGKSSSGLTTYRVVQPSGYFSEEEYDIELKKDSENSKLYFEFNGEIKYLEDFEFIPITELIDKLESQTEENFVSDNQIVATLLKEGDNITVSCPLSKIRCSIKQFGISLTNPCDTQNIECIFTEKRYSKKDWPFNIEVIAQDPEMRFFFSGRDFYTGDFCSMLRDGRIKFIDPRKYINVMFMEEEKKPHGLFRKLFGKR